MEKLAIFLIALILISVGFFSGCTDNQINNELDKFIGTWAIEEPEDEVYNATWTFYENNTVKITFDFQGQPLYYWGTYQIENGQLYLTSQETTPPSATYDYEFSNSDTRLTLSNEEATMVMNKVT